MYTGPSYVRQRSLFCSFFFFFFFVRVFFSSKECVIPIDDLSLVYFEGLGIECGMSVLYGINIIILSWLAVGSWQTIVSISLDFRQHLICKMFMYFVKLVHLTELLHINCVGRQMPKLLLIIIHSNSYWEMGFMFCTCFNGVRCGSEQPVNYYLLFILTQFICVLVPLSFLFSYAKNIENMAKGPKARIDKILKK